MVKRGSFARDWHLIKLSRSWHPHDVAGKILSRLVAGGAPGVAKAVADIAYALGTEEGREFLGRMPAGMDAVSVLESFFLVTGISCDLDTEGKQPVLYIKKECGSLFGNGGCTPEVAAEFIRGFVHAVASPAHVRDQDDVLIVDLSYV
ncbi:MAG: hypothetical protein GKC04_08890 [Methanomicrobiales archaeon]|nr:hypothetical protein [Methanomicrobiales archaeon]